MRILKSAFLIIITYATLSVYAEDDILSIDSIQYSIGDAFDDSKYHTKYDKWAYDVLNWIHIETRESTVRKLLLFNVHDTVSQLQIQEAERFLRNQNFLSDANISIEKSEGKNIAHVSTSDNWTLSLPVSIGFSGSEWNYDNLRYGIGIQESNFLGLGQRLGFYYGHDEFRNMWQLAYGDPHFLFRYNKLDIFYSYNTDGYLASWKMYMPYLTRTQNQWAYTIEGLKNERNAYFYGSGKLPPAAKIYNTQKSLDSLPLYNSKDEFKLMKLKHFIEDSLSFRFSRSFGGAFRKFYIGATYDYKRMTADKGTLYRYVFTDGENAYAIDSAKAYSDWLPEQKDSRLGLYFLLSNIRYQKIKNFHNAKWTEDIEKGYSLKAQISKNYTQLGAADNDIRLDFFANICLGEYSQHLTLNSEMNFYLDNGNMRDYYAKITGEYLLHPTNSFSTVLSGLLDFYKDTNFGKQLSLGGGTGFTGFPTGFYTGQARVFANLEQRYFTNFEIATIMPVLAVFASAGETAWELNEINRKDLIYVAGFGVRFAQTKSISRLINKLDISIPLNGVRKGEPHYSLITVYNL